MRPAVVAHRGFSARFPENTLAAVRGAIELGVDYVEIDVQETRDGKLVVFHDYRLDRLCGVKGRVCDTRFAQIRRLNPAVPLLADVLRVCARKTRVLIEIKGADPRKVAAVIERWNMVDRVTVFSLSIPRIKAMAQANPHIPRFGLVARNLKTQLTALKESVSVQGVGISRRLVTSAAVVRTIHRQGWKLFVWTVNRQEEMRQLASWGVDGLITNHPDRALQV